MNRSLLMMIAQIGLWIIVRRFLSCGAQILGLVILPEVIDRLSDPMSGYFIVRRSSIANQPLSPVGCKILIEVVARGQIRWIAEAIDRDDKIVG